MLNRKRRIDTIEQAIAAYGGRLAIEREFIQGSKGKPQLADTWVKTGHINRDHFLGMYLGLQALGHTPMPALFGVAKWLDVPGHPRPTKGTRKGYPKAANARRRAVA